MQHKDELKKERFELLSRVEQSMEGPMIFLGFVWLVLLVVEFIHGLSPALEIISISIWVIFIIDFVIKFILAPEKVAFLKQNWLTILSLILPALRLIRVARVLRVVRGLRGVRLVKIVGSLNRGMKSLAATMKRRGVKYVVLLTLVVVFAGAAGMLAFEKDHGLKNYGEALWWTAMLITSIASEYWPQTGEGKVLCLILSMYGLGVFGYITATIASFFVGRDAEEKDAPLASSQDIQELKLEISRLAETISKLNKTT